jgi:uncharacterized protein YcnI
MHTPTSLSMSFTVRALALAALALTAAASAQAHVVLEDQTALAGRSYKAVFKIGHGCDGAPTTAISVRLPAGFRGAKPMPKAGWTLRVERSTLTTPYDDYGKRVTEDVTQITWTASSKEQWLPDDWYDEFVLQGGLPSEARPLWFKVLQTCDKTSANWDEVPASGTSTKGLKRPAALLELIPSEQAGGHQH